MSFSFFCMYFFFCPKRRSLSMLVFGMVLIGWSILCFSISLLLLTPVTKLIGIVRTEVSVAPNVELNGRKRQILLTIMKQITIKCSHVSNCFEWDSNNQSSTLHVKCSGEGDRVGGRQKANALCLERSLLLQPAAKAPASSSSSPFNPTLCACPSKLEAHNASNTTQSITSPIPFHSHSRIAS